MKNKFNTVLEAIQSPPAVAIADLVRSLEKSGEKIAKMQTGEPCFYTPDYIKNALIAAIHENKTQYTSSQGIPELRSTISKWYENDYNVNIPPEEILITQGAVGGIYCVVTALINKGDEVILIDPAWPQYANIVRLNGGNLVRVSTRQSNGKLVLKELEKNITEKTKLIILNNPSNPAGITYGKEDVNDFVDLASKHNIYILFDEVYNRLVFGNKFCSVLNSDLYVSNKDKIIYVNSFSKTFAMTGWRIGYSFMPASILQKALLVSQNILTNISTFSQYAAKVAIEKEKENITVFEEMKRFYLERNNELIEILNNKKMSFMQPEGAFYVFIRIGRDSVSFAEELLRNEKIAVVPGLSYGADFNDYFRISFAVDNYSYDRFVSWLKSYNHVDYE
jgi:aspartate aminotransferase